MTLLQAIILAVVEGLTEFLPISSTSHLVLASFLLGLEQSPFVKLFTVGIQCGAILAIIVVYLKRFFTNLKFYYRLFIAFLPAAIAGLLLSKYIDRLLETPLVIAISLIVGGVIFLFVDKWFSTKEAITDEQDIDYKRALKIGLIQCIALIPGVSRSGASIIGGMSQKLSRRVATEFSFFLGVPTIAGATAKKLLDFYQDGYHITPKEIQLLVIGNAVGFIIALFTVWFFINYIAKHGFKLFGWYRILLGCVLLGLLIAGYTITI